MTDTPTPQMTPEQRAELVGWLRKPYECTHGDDVADMAVAANQLEADGATIATLTAECDAAKDGEKTARNLMQKSFDVNRKVIAERDAAQAEIARLTAALATPDQIAALAAERAATVTVKPLEWVKDTMPNAAPQRYRAATHDGTGDYSVSGSKNSDAWQWFRNGYFVDGHQHHKPMPLDAAKAAAQADYDARIRSAITITSGASPDTIPLPRAEVKALMEAAKRGMLQADENQWSERWYFDACVFLAILQERMK